MRTRLFLALVAFSTIALASSYFPQFYHNYRPEVGFWSRYDMADSAGNRATITISVVGKEGANYWIEVESTMAADSGIAGYLVSGDPTDDSNVLKVRLKNSDGPIIEIARETLEKLRKAQASQAAPSGIGPSVGKIQTFPNETVKAGSRSYECQKIRLTSPEGRFADIWLSDDVVPFGVVKLQSGDESLVLKEAGKGAKPRLLGEATPLVIEGEMK